MFEEAPYLDKEVLKLYKLRKLLSKAWLPLGISKDEAVDILCWAVGDDVGHLNFLLWPERIKENTGIRFDERTTPIIQIFRMVAKEWKKRHPITFYKKGQDEKIP